MIGIGLITIVVLIIYILNQKSHIDEINKINRLEEIYSKKQNYINDERSKTIECPIKNLNNPRVCYFGSNYKCSWNEKAERCDKK